MAIVTSQAPQNINDGDALPPVKGAKGGDVVEGAASPDRSTRTWKQVHVWRERSL